MSDVFGAPCDRDIGFTLLTGGRGGHVGRSHNWDAYIVAGKQRRIGVPEARKMMGIPESFVFPVSDTQAMKQLGNGVAVSAVQAVAKNLLLALRVAEKV